MVEAAVARGELLALVRELTPLARERAEDNEIQRRFLPTLLTPWCPAG